MRISRADHSDLKEIMKIVKDAQDYLGSLGIDQWQNGYPQDFVIQEDIENKEFYLMKKSDELLGISMFSSRGEPSYDKIDGDWLTPNDSAYGVIHRMAVLTTHKKGGLAQYMFEHFENELKESEIKSMRIDTHKDNLGMQGLLKKRGYSYCGIIIVRDGSERLAFEKII
jgi:ribosomal protein S18 acetylase RimI-like enzyme